MGFRAIRLSFDLHSDATDEVLDALIEATERYCVVLQTMSQPPDFSVAHHRRNEPATTGQE